MPTTNPPVSTGNKHEIQAQTEEARKKAILQSLHGSCPDFTMAEPPEIPPEYDLPRRYDLIE